jgi:hypothetical protein
MASRLHIVLQVHLRSSQFCGVPGNSILEAVSQVAVAYCETTGNLCVFSLWTFKTPLTTSTINIYFKSYKDVGSRHGSLSESKYCTIMRRPQFKLMEPQQGPSTSIAQYDKDVR